MKKIAILLVCMAFALSLWAQAPAPEANKPAEGDAAVQCPCCKEMSEKGAEGAMCKRMAGHKHMDMKEGCCGKHQHDAKATDTANATKDPVCGMPVDPKTAKSFEYKGTTYHFCCDDCLKKFKADPAKYLAKK